MIVDTIDDVVIGDVGDEVVNTGGVAVRPFWWSNECLGVLGYASEDGGTTAATGASGGDDSDGATGEGESSGADTGHGSQDQATGAGVILKAAKR